MSGYDTVEEETRAQRKKLRGKGVKAHLQYYWDYYRWPVLIAAAAVIFAVSILHGILTQKQTAFSVVLINSGTYSGDTYNALREKLGRELAIDPSSEEVYLDLNATLSVGSFSSRFDMATLEKLAAQQSSGDIDCMIADAVNFEYYTKAGSFVLLSDVLDEEQIDALRDRIYYVDGEEIAKWQELTSRSDYELPVPTREEIEKKEGREGYCAPDPADMEQPEAVGILLDESPLLNQYGLYAKTIPVLGFCQAARHPEQAAEFLRIALQNP